MKLLVLLAAGALVLTGCAANESIKSSEQKNKSKQNDSKKDNNGSKSKENAEIKHDLAVAEKLAHLVAISGNDLKRLNEQTNKLTY